jgi:hypothetical protein
MNSKIKFLFFISLILLVVGCIREEPKFCTSEAKICEDGTGVGRNPELNCEFNPCPELESCNAETPCSEGKTCYKFPGKETPYCFNDETGDPCIKCPSNTCKLLKTLPMQIQCT